MLSHAPLFFVSSSKILITKPLKYMENAVVKNQEVVISANQLLDQWQGHRRLTRRVIEAFPEDKLFNYSIGGMRSFSVLAMEMIEMYKRITVLEEGK